MSSQEAAEEVIPRYPELHKQAISALSSENSTDTLGAPLYDLSFSKVNLGAGFVGLASIKKVYTEWKNIKD